MTTPQNTTSPAHVDCPACHRTTHWCQCDTHPAGVPAEVRAEAVAFLAELGIVVR